MQQLMSAAAEPLMEPSVMVCMHMDMAMLTAWKNQNTPKLEVKFLHDGQ